MKIKNMRILVAAALMAASAITVSAQDTRSGYFLDDYTYRYQMNPAFGNSRGFVSMPGIGNLNLQLNGTLALSDVIYNVNGKTTTFLNPNLSAAEVLKNIGDQNRIGYDLKVNVLSVGFKGFGGYNTISVNARSSMCAKLPGSIFSLLKEGVANKTYDIGRVNAFANAFAEISLGHSHQLTSDLRIGASLKFLVGAGNADIDIEHADMTLGRDEWTITTEGSAHANIRNFTYKTDVNSRTGHRYVSGVDIDKFGIGGYGVAIDLGAVWSPAVLPDWTFSAALLDLGFINWNTDVLATTGGRKTFTTDKYTFSVDDDAPNSFDNEWDRIRDDFSAIYELDDAGDQGSRTRMLGSTLNLGAQYRLPVYNRLSFGLLNTTRIQGKYSWTDFRLSANVVPCKVFDAAVNLSGGTFGVGFGWLVNLHAPGFNLFLGMDRTVAKLAKQGVPLNTNGSVNFGLNFLF